MGFNPRPRVEGDPDVGPCRVHQQVSIHAPAWGATRRAGSSRFVSVRFQSTPPRGGRRCFCRRSCCWWRFNPRPRVGGDKRWILPRHTIKVSIHAPAWGATRYGRVSRCIVNVSIHAPAWGATVQGQVRHHSAGVSIHAPAWGATPGLVGHLLRVSVSIHAPAWGATWTSRPAGSWPWCFNPRPRVGGDERLEREASAQ